MALSAVKVKKALSLDILNVLVLREIIYNQKFIELSSKNFHHLNHQYMFSTENDSPLVLPLQKSLHL